MRLFLPFFVLLLITAPAQALHIVLDPGHGGVDTGAVHGPAKEADLVLEVAQRLKKLLDQNPTFQVTLTRNQDRNISLQDRVHLAERKKADLFVSLHANAALDKRAKGVEFFFQNYLPPDEESLYLANQENQALDNQVHHNTDHDSLSKKGDIAAILEDLRRQNRLMSSLRLTQTLTNVWEQEADSTAATIKQAPFYVISKTSMPSVLIEIGFLTNPRESKRLLSSDYQNDLAQKIYTALVSYQKKLDKPATNALN